MYVQKSAREGFQGKKETQLQPNYNFKLGNYPPNNINTKSKFPKHFSCKSQSIQERKEEEKLGFVIWEQLID